MSGDIEGVRALAGCNLGVGCDEAGVCYAMAHNRPDMCGRSGEPYSETWPCPICGGCDDTEQLMCEACGGSGMLGSVEPLTYCTPTTQASASGKAEGGEA